MNGLLQNQNAKNIAEKIRDTTSQFWKIFKGHNYLKITLSLIKQIACTPNVFQGKVHVCVDTVKFRWSGTKGAVRKVQTRTAATALPSHQQITLVSSCTYCIRRSNCSWRLLPQMYITQVRQEISTFPTPCQSRLAIDLYLDADGRELRALWMWIRRAPGQVTDGRTGADRGPRRRDFLSLFDQ